MTADEKPLPVLARKVTIPNPEGLHARPAMQFMDVAGRFQSRIKVKKGDQVVDGRDPMELLLLDAPKGTELELEADGPDAADALDALARLVADGFGEMKEKKKRKR